MHIDPWTLAFQAINVLILVWLLTRFLYRPVTAAIAARQAAADKLLDDAAAQKKAASDEAEALKAARDAVASEAERQSSAIHAEIDKERARLIAAARAEAASVAVQAEAAAAAARARVTAELEGKASVLAGRMAETLLRRMPAPAMTEAMFGVLMDALRALSADERARLSADQPLTMVTALSLPPEGVDRYGKAVAEVLALPSPPAASVDPDMIAGFELRGQHMRVTNSWRADLDQMLAALRENGNGRHA